MTVLPSETVSACKSCVQRIEGCGSLAFTTARPLAEGCYGEVHVMWDALAAASEIVVADVGDRLR